MENKDYYVYEHIRLDNNTCFYVGKGRGERYKSKKETAITIELLKNME